MKSGKRKVESGKPLRLARKSYGRISLRDIPVEIYRVERGPIRRFIRNFLSNLKTSQRPNV